MRTALNCLRNVYKRVPYWLERSLLTYLIRSSSLAGWKMVYALMLRLGKKTGSVEFMSIRVESRETMLILSDTDLFKVLINSHFIKVIDWQRGACHTIWALVLKLNGSICRHKHIHLSFGTNINSCIHNSQVSHWKLIKFLFLDSLKWRSFLLWYWLRNWEAILKSYR